MSKNVYEAIRILRKNKKSDITRQTLTDSEVNAVCEVCLNLLHGNLGISNKSRTKLKRFKLPIKQLSNKGISNIRKRKVINQQGGFLSAIAGIALPLLTNLLISTISKKKKPKKK